MIVTVLLALHDPVFRFTMASLLTSSDSYFFRERVYIAALIVATVLVDYVSIFRTRIILNLLVRHTRFLYIWYPTVFIADFVLLWLGMTASIILLIGPAVLIAMPFEPNNYLTAAARAQRFFKGHFDQFTWCAVLTNLIPSIWTWAALTAGILSRALARARPIGPLLINLLPIREYPWRSIGLVAGLVITTVYLAAGMLAWWVR